MDAATYTSRIIKSFADLRASEWNALDGAYHPFLRYEFFLSLEQNGNLNHASGWDCRLVCLFDKHNGSDRLIAAMPMFLKDHSWAEFVFDWAWANSYAQHGIAYYPKLVVTTPYTPASARKCLTHPQLGQEYLASKLIQTAMDHAKHEAVSSLHALFLTDTEQVIWQEHGLLKRIDVQFHWQNRWQDKQDACFDDFLARMTSSKRKKIRQERRSIQKQHVDLKIQKANEIDPELWQDIYQCYANTFLLRGQPPYFSKELFLDLANSMGEQMPIIQAFQNNLLLGTAICFQSNEVLYGRYWGKMADINNLHFETCFYQTIDYALHQKLKHIEPGTGGTHKLRRGFEPTLTTSMHWIAHEGFRDAIADHLQREHKAILEYKEDAKGHLPFKQK
ncbi:MAG: GNAT family N-acetyltransferase [Gammaproteobacteria bacterium]|nr:GNAT family N-acetyltransferase [Gammaproteobacteria bacterium]